MRIKFTDTGEECQISGINPDPKNTVCAGRYVARHGKLYEGVEDITQYKTVLVDGVKTKVEVLPEEMNQIQLGWSLTLSYGSMLRA